MAKKKLKSPTAAELVKRSSEYYNGHCQFEISECSLEELTAIMLDLEKLEETIHNIYHIELYYEERGSYYTGSIYNGQGKLMMGASKVRI